MEGVVSDITCKFGGTSLAGADNVLKARAILDADPNRRFVVPSAPGKRTPDDRKITDLLLAWHDIAVRGFNPSEPRDIVEQRFRELNDGLGLDFDVAGALAEIDMQLQDRLQHAEAGNPPSPDFMASRGEYLNGRLMALLLDAEFIDPADFIHFTETGRIDPITYERLGARLRGDGRYVIPGFYGSSPDGAIKTFSRGGSDITGAIVARATSSALYENWTDVSGFCMTDPRIVPGAKYIAEVTYAELRELAYMGARVLHDESIDPVRDVGIPIVIRNTHDPEHAGTRIVPQREALTPVCGVAGIAGFSMINVAKAFMNKEHGFGCRLLTVLEDHDIAWEHMPTGIDTISLILRDEELGDMGPTIIDEIQQRCQPDEINLSRGLAMIATVGQGMNRHIGIAARLCTAIAEAGVNLRVIDQGSSEMNIIIGVEEEDLDKAVSAIYHAFVE